MLAFSTAGVQKWCCRVSVVACGSAGVRQCWRAAILACCSASVSSAGVRQCWRAAVPVVTLYGVMSWSSARAGWRKREERRWGNSFWRGREMVGKLWGEGGERVGRVLERELQGS